MEQDFRNFSIGSRRFSCVYVFGCRANKDIAIIELVRNKKKSVSLKRSSARFYS